ncbi:MAG TPA: hypothetical protein VGE77_09940, partial [Nocardioides sp.]
PRSSRFSGLAARLRALDLPPLPETAAVVATGAITGLVLVLLGGVSLQLCSVVQGSGSCGTPVLLMLIGAAVVGVIVGARLLRAWEVSDPGSTSFLGVGLFAMIALIFLIDVLFAWVMVVVVPIVTVAMFLLSHFLTTKLSEGAEDVHPPGR